MLTAHGLCGLDDVFAWRGGERLDKPGLEPWRQRWRVRLADVGGQESAFYLKRFDHPPFKRQWQRWRSGEIAASTAGIEWRNAHALADAGVRAAEPVAFGEHRVGPYEVRSFIMLGGAAGTSLERWVPEHVPPAHAESDQRRRRAMLDGLARFVAKFHAAGFVHRDLYLCHIFFDHDRVTDDGPGAQNVNADARAADAAAFEDAFCLIDLQRVFRPCCRKQRWLVKDLAALHYSTPAEIIGDRERLRFLCRYARLLRGPASTKRSASDFARRLARQVEDKTSWMARRQSRLKTAATR